MILGQLRDHLPRLTLALPSRDGKSIAIEFVIDTGFDGYLTLPTEIARQVIATPFGPQTQQLADGSYLECPVVFVTLEWQDEERDVETLILGRTPLVGTLFLMDCHLAIELYEGGAVTVETL